MLSKGMVVCALVLGATAFAANAREFESKVEDNGDHYKYEYKDPLCEYKYEYNYKDGKQKLKRHGDCAHVAVPAAPQPTYVVPGPVIIQPRIDIR